MNWKHSLMQLWLRIFLECGAKNQMCSSGSSSSSVFKSLQHSCFVMSTSASSKLIKLILTHTSLLQWRSSKVNLVLVKSNYAIYSPYKMLLKRWQIANRTLHGGEKYQFYWLCGNNYKPDISRLAHTIKYSISLVSGLSVFHDFWGML